MKVDVKKLQRSRRFSVDFKKKLVREYESGNFTVKELCDLHAIAGGVLYRWIDKFGTFPQDEIRVIEMSESSDQKVKELQRKIKELERIVGQKQITIDYLNTMMDVAKDELNIDIKKNFGTAQSKGSGKKK